MLIAISPKGLNYEPDHSWSGGRDCTECVENILFSKYVDILCHFEPPAGSEPAGGLNLAGCLLRLRPEGVIPYSKGLRKTLDRSSGGS